ncbi:MAG: hypothetical protein L0212_03815 [Acidobacteria bacterium]|nr:hypothetical protein [Acidobacteriota bacterium]
MSENELVATAPPLPLAHDLDALMEFRRGLVRRRDYKPLGRLGRLVIDPSGIDPERSKLKLNGRPAILDWYGTGPLVALSTVGEEILFASPVAKPPAIPDQKWTPPASWALKAQRTGNFLPPKPPMVEQNLLDYAYSGVQAKDGREWLLFQPVNQLEIFLSDKAGLAVVNCSADALGRHAALLYDPKNGEAHLLFGWNRVDLCTA